MNITQLGRAFKALDQRLHHPLRLIIGGGAALMAAYEIPVKTKDVDGVPDKTSMDFADFKREVEAVGRQLDLPPDWLNDYFGTFMFVLPADYGTRLKTLYKGKNLEACALGKEDLILMKCFAGREKDIPHARALMRKEPDLTIVDHRLHELMEKNIPGSQKAADFFDDLCSEMGLWP